MHRWASLRTELLWIYDGPVALESRQIVADHRHGYWVWLIRSGTATVEMNGTSWHAKAGQWLISPHGITKQIFSPDARILSLHFRCEWPTGESLFAERGAIILESKEFARLEKSATSLRVLVNRHFPRVRLDFTLHPSGYSVFLRLQQRFFQWLLDFSETLAKKGYHLAQTGKCDERLLRVAQCLHEANLGNPYPSTQLQRETGLGRAHLDRLYLKEFGVTTREYWERLREESAIRKIESTSLSIKEIGYQLGFKQASHFTKWFLHRTRQTPKTYRQAIDRNRTSGGFVSNLN
jgi:AraC-like DNA-binding protein